MLKHYFKAALRNLQRQKLYTCITIVGLAAGLTVCLVVLGNISYEFSFEDFHENKDRIYRVECDYSFEDEQFSSARTMAPLGAAMIDEIPGIEKTTVFRVWRLSSVKFSGKRTLIVDNNMGSMVVHHPKVIFADPDYLEVFTLPMVEGNPQSALTEPFSALITETAASRYFPDRSPIGQIFEINDRVECLVTGVLKDIPQNTQLYCDFVVSYSTLDRIGEDTQSWHKITGDYTYLLLRENARASDIIDRVPPIARRHLDDQDAAKWKFRIKPLKDIYFSALGPVFSRGELNPIGEPSCLLTYGVLAAFVLIIAIANFINLSTARSADRTKEVGVRKVFGASRKHLIHQFLGESIIMTAIATIIGVCIYEPFKTWMDDYLRREMMVDFYNSPMMLISTVALMLLVGVAAGYYPSLYLSRFRPVAILQSKTSIRSSRSFLRRALVVFQFAVAGAFIFVTLTLMRQIIHVTSLDVKFDTANMMVMNVESEEAANDCQLLKNEILARTDAISATTTNCPPGKETYRYQVLYTDDARQDSNLVYFKSFSVDSDYISMFGLRVTQGSPFTEEMIPSADNVIIVTESLVEEMEWQEPIGEILYLKEEGFVEVVGVIEDYHATPFTHGYSSELILMFRPEDRTSLVVKLPQNNVAASISTIGDIWNSTLPDYEFTYSFLDENIAANYDEMWEQSALFLVLSFFTVGIACLGIFGLVSFTAEQRRKEIGIRKVLGASVSGIVRLLSKEFVVLVLIANIVGLPLGSLVAHDFLSEQPLPVGLNLFSYIAVCLAAVILALGTAAFQSIKAALTNPVETLRSE
ncbi:MAG: ABC transporter permease [Candidatus Zixiibacteriota bacterium]|nr:MAG: ABC transporter permease [candidate division Zixibacteria bacterium]